MNEFVIDLNDGDKHLYQQIYEYIKNEIKEGKLLQEEKLPSTRSLAQYLQISRTTVDFAYEQLVSEGYIEAKPNRGYFVCGIKDLYDFHNISQREITEEIQKEMWDVDFSPNGIDMNGFPFGIWRSIHKHTLIDDSKELFSLGMSEGELPLRESISRYLHSSRGVNCEAKQIIIGAGNDYLLLLLEKILGITCHIAMEEYTYKKAYRIFEACKFLVTPICMEDTGISIERLRSTDANTAYVMPSHQFPTGLIMPIGKRVELLEWANEDNSRFIIEDDYDSEFRYRGKPIPALLASDTQNKVIYIGTFSKAIAPAIRVSYMVLPKSLLNQYYEKAGFFSSTVSRIDQTILNTFITQGHFERHLNKMRKRYKNKHDLLMSLLKPFEIKFSILGENAGLHLLLKCKNDATEESLVKQAESVGVKVYGMSKYYIGQKNDILDTPAVILLGYGGLSEGDIQKGIEGLKKVWL